MLSCKKGGRLHFSMGSAPDKKRGTLASAYPIPFQRIKWQNRFRCRELHNCVVLGNPLLILILLLVPVAL